MKRRECAAPRALVALMVAFMAVHTHATPNVVYYEPQLDTQLSEHIHPYAFAHRYPDPYYEAHHTSDADADAFDSFLKLQTHVPASLVETSSKTSEHEHATATAQHKKFIFSSIKKALSSSAGGDSNPASDKPMKFPGKGSPSPFQTSIQHDSGVLGNHFRRAVYGLRRRRMPFTGNLMVTHLNPFRRPNSFTNTPQDMMAPRARFEAAVNPKMTDMGSLGGTSDKGFSHRAYGGYTSFGRPPTPSFGDIRHAARQSMGMFGQPAGPGDGLGSLGMGMAGAPVPQPPGGGLSLGSMGTPPAMWMEYPQAFAPAGFFPPGFVPTAEKGFHPYAGGSPTFVPGDHTFHDVYTGGVLGGAGAEGGEGG